MITMITIIVIRMYKSNFFVCYYSINSTNNKLKGQIMLTSTSLLALMMVPIVSMIAMSLLVSLFDKENVHTPST